MMTLREISVGIALFIKLVIFFFCSIVLLCKEVPVHIWLLTSNEHLHHQKKLQKPDQQRNMSFWTGGAAIFNANF